MLHDIDLVRYYVEQWGRYTTGASCLNRLFMFLNRYWIRRERDEGKKTVYPIYTVKLYGPFVDLSLIRYPSLL